jgi:nucleoside-diphosphate-sugar epimerase
VRIFVTGASGWIGSAVVPELLAAGHQVVGLARSADAAATVAALGAEPYRGGIDDCDRLAEAAAQADGVVHLAYNHDFSRIREAAQTDLAVINAIGAALAGTDRPFLVASGVLGLSPGRVATEQDPSDPHGHPRAANALAAQSLAQRGVRSLVARFAPTVHGDGDHHGFVARLVAIAREKGASGYIDEGRNRWPAIHRLDAARLVRLAVEHAPAGSVLHAVAEEGVPTRAIAETIGRRLGLPVVCIPADQATEHFGWLARLFGADSPASNRRTRELLDWQPIQPGLIADLDQGHYFD